MIAYGVPSFLQQFDATRSAALERLARVNPARYGKTRNNLDGAVTGLSPYITHGLLSIPEAVRSVHRKHPLNFNDKLVAEFAWREFFHHVWHHQGDAILDNLRDPVWPGTYSRMLPPDVREGRTGVRAIDAAVRVLYSSGYLHNHARMWLASYLVHYRKVHWRAGADWMLGHLLDGDLASNHLSWQWVAGTFSNKPYLFNADNVAKFAPTSASAQWESPGSVIDQSYEALDAVARSGQKLEPQTAAASGITEPALASAPRKIASFDAGMIDGKVVELVHPWALSDAPKAAEGESRFSAACRIGVVHLPFHKQFAWSDKRWQFVMSRMEAVCDGVFVGDLAQLRGALAGAASVSAVATLNPGYRQALEASAQLTPAPRLLPNPDKLQSGFMRFYERVQQGAPSLDTLLKS